MGKDGEKPYGRNGAADINRIVIGINGGSTETEIDPWALTELVDNSEKWKGNNKTVLYYNFLTAHMFCTCCRNIHVYMQRAAPFYVLYGLTSSSFPHIQKC